MTVCVAAYGNIRPDGFPVLAAAADRMITIADIEYEPDQTKSVYLATQTVALLAGQMEVHASVCPATAESLQSNPPSPFLVKAIAERYATQYALYRRYWGEQEILMPLGMTISDFLMRQREFSEDFARSIHDQLKKNAFNAPAIIAGIDQTGAHIYKIIDPGIAVSFDTPCFAAIGIGQPHAETHLMSSQFHKACTPEELIYSVFAAKLQAEIAAGVGGKTDLLYIRGPLRHPDLPGGIFPVVEKEVADLRRICENKRAADKVNEAAAVAAISEILNRIPDRPPIPAHMAGQQTPPPGPSSAPAPDSQVADQKTGGGGDA